MSSLDFTSSLPSWLDQELFDKAIRSYTSDPQAKVSNFDIKAATQPGENFASAVFRATIKFTSKYCKDVQEMSVIIKTQPANADLPGMDHLRDTTLFETEIAAYTGVLEKIQELIKGAGYEDFMGPKLIYQTLTPKPIIMLEDVKAIGYDTLITTPHDDFEISKMIFKRLAKFHAAGYYLQDEKKIDAASFSTSIFKMDSIVAIFETNFDVLLNYLTEWEGYEQFIEPIRTLKSTFSAKCRQSYEAGTGPGAFNVLNHGDFHLKNVLYRMNKEDGKAEDFVALDYQVCIYGTPAIDFAYAFFNFVSDDNRFQYFDELLFIYHTQFVEALRTFGYLKNPPSLLDLQVELLKNGHLQAFNFLHLFPMSIMNLNDFKDDDLEPGFTGMMKKAYKNENYKKILKRNLTRFLNKGFFG